MKNLAIPSVWVTTCVLAALVVASLMGVSFGLLLFLCGIGSLLVPAMVFLVLTDSYTTNKTFDDWYGDRPKTD